MSLEDKDRMDDSMFDNPLDSADFGREVSYWAQAAGVELENDDIDSKEVPSSADNQEQTAEQPGMLKSSGSGMTSNPIAPNRPTPPPIPMSGIMTEKMTMKSVKRKLGIAGVLGAAALGIGLLVHGGGIDNGLDEYDWRDTYPYEEQDVYRPDDLGPIEDVDYAFSEGELLAIKPVGEDPYCALREVSGYGSASFEVPLLTIDESTDIITLKANIDWVLSQQTTIEIQFYNDSNEAIRKVVLGPESDRASIELEQGQYYMTIRLISYDTFTQIITNHVPTFETAMEGGESLYFYPTEDVSINAGHSYLQWLESNEDVALIEEVNANDSSMKYHVTDTNGYSYYLGSEIKEESCTWVKPGEYTICASPHHVRFLGDIYIKCQPGEDITFYSYSETSFNRMFVDAPKSFVDIEGELRQLEKTIILSGVEDESMPDEEAGYFLADKYIEFGRDRILLLNLTDSKTEELLSLIGRKIEIDEDESFWTIGTECYQMLRGFTGILITGENTVGNIRIDVPNLPLTTNQFYHSNGYSLIEYPFGE